MAKRKKIYKAREAQGPSSVKDRNINHSRLIAGIAISVLYYYIQKWSDGDNDSKNNDSSISVAIANGMMKNIQNNNDANKSHETTCKYYFAKSKIPNAGYGIFTTQTIQKGEKVGPDDVVIHVPDINPLNANAMHVLLFDYAWEAMGGAYEGKTVFSMVPGIGSMANGHQTMFNTEAGLGPEVDHAGLIRGVSPGAGASSHYHNFPFRATRRIEAGEEILNHYGSNWFKERDIKGKVKSPENLKGQLRYSTEWLKTNGICLDSIRVGRSTKLDAGRGAFATRPITKGSILAPAPVVQIVDRKALEIEKIREDGVKEVTNQLILNYCYGHSNSSALFFPYAPLINFINHDYQDPNVELRWSDDSTLKIKNMSIADVRDMEHAGLLMEFVVKRDIQEGEEIFMSYGKEWERAWASHVEQRVAFLAPDHGHGYAFEFDQKFHIIPTQEEQRSISNKKFPDNIFVSCFYSYKESSNLDMLHGHMRVWKESKNIQNHKNMRPCVVLDRHDRSAKNGDSQVFYTVAILNRFGLSEEERIPKGTHHIVTGVPRRALRFSSKIYTTDQHSPDAFRHEIELNIIPEHWRDLTIKN